MRTRDLNQRETALLLAGLRMLQRKLGEHEHEGLPEGISEILLDGRIDPSSETSRARSVLQIDELCEAINFDWFRRGLVYR